MCAIWINNVPKASMLKFSFKNVLPNVRFLLNNIFLIEACLENLSKLQFANLPEFEESDV